jgi:hypothetical protein
MSSGKDLLDWVIITMQRRAEMLKELVQLVGSLSAEGTMKLKPYLMGSMDAIIIDLFQGAGKMDQLVECKCSQDKFSRE